MQLEVGELREYHVVEIVTLQRESHGIIECHVNELTLLLVYDVVIADQLLAALRLAHLVWLVSYTTGDKCVTDANEPFLNEVHLVHFLILIINYLIEKIVLKATRKESLGDLEEQTYVLLLVQRALGVVKEPLERCDDVLE